jgi:hypothetical protein
MINCLQFCFIVAFTFNLHRYTVVTGKRGIQLGGRSGLADGATVCMELRGSGSGGAVHVDPRLNPD